VISWWQLEFAELLLKRSKVGSMTIRELVSASGLSRQTVQRYLKSFEETGLVVRSRVVEGRGRPQHRYKPTMKLARAVSKGLGAEMDKVLISFKVLRRTYKWGNGGFCKKKVKKCTPTICPIIKASKEIM
jgi:predicted ArsR family transcriptional regulator